MRTSLIKPIVIGVLLGAGFFWIPFIVVRILLLFIIVGFIFRLVMWRRWRKGNPNRFTFADRIRSMSEEEYASFKQNPWHFCREHRQDSPDQKTN
jgi:hypothetical protein